MSSPARGRWTKAVFWVAAGLVVLALPTLFPDAFAAYANEMLEALRRWAP